MTKDARTCPPPCVTSGCGVRVDRVRVSAAGTGPRTSTWRRVLRSLLELLVEGRRSTIQMRGLALSEPDVPVALGGKMIEYFAAAAADSAESSGVGPETTGRQVVVFADDYGDPGRLLALTAGLRSIARASDFEGERVGIAQFTAADAMVFPDRRAAGRPGAAASGPDRVCAW